MKFYIYFDVLSQSYAVQRSTDNLLGTYGQGREYYFAGFTRAIDASQFTALLNRIDNRPETFVRG